MANHANVALTDLMNDFLFHPDKHVYIYQYVKNRINTEPKNLSKVLFHEQKLIHSEEQWRKLNLRFHYHVG